MGGADGPDIDELGEALRVLENAVNIEEEPDHGAISTRANTNPERFRAEEEADKYAEYVAMGWREPEVQDVGKLYSTRLIVGPKATSSEPRRSSETLTSPDMEEQSRMQRLRTFTLIKL